MNPVTGSHPDIRSFRRVVLKALGLYLLANLAFGVLDPMPVLERMSLYNTIVPGRTRLPYAEDPDLAYNVSVDRLGPMLASHEVSEPPAPDEYRVFILGDSSVWGFLLRPEETLSGQVNQQDLRLPDGRQVRAYNLGYPVMSVLKDLTLLEAALPLGPDLVVWMVSLEAFPYDKQLASALLQSQPDVPRSLIQAHSLSIPTSSPELALPSFWDRTLIGQRRALADLIRLQLYGVMWAATGIDQHYPEAYPMQNADQTDELEYHDMQPPELVPSALAFEVLSAGEEMLDGIPVLIINEPIFISDGQNSHLRYNDLYPRWAYDEYRRLLAGACAEHGWACLDYWDTVAPTEFTNTAIHLTPAGTLDLARRVAEAVLDAAGSPEAKPGE
jgi:hypothetical protein